MQILWKTVGCGKNSSSRALLELTKCHSRSFFVERFRLLYKYVLCDHGIEGVFSLLWPDLEISDSKFAKWYRNDTTFVESYDEPPRIELTIHSANNSRNAAAGEQLKYDEHVWNTLCNQTFVDNEININRLYEHLEPNEFAFLCDLLGNRVDLLKPGRVCFCCGPEFF